MTVMGLQVTPTRAVTSETSMPKRPRRVEMAGSVASPVLLQHWRLPVVHWLPGLLPPPLGAAVAAARIEATEKAVRALNCMLIEALNYLNDGWFE